MVPIAGLALLFTRLDGPTVLAHDARRRILARVGEAPGLQLAQLADDVSLDPKTVAYHLRQLQRIGSVHVVRDGRARRCYPPGAAPRAAVPDARALDAMWVLRMGVTGAAGVARALRMPRGTAGSLLVRLARRGLVVRDGQAFRPAPEAFSGEGGLDAP